MNGGLLARLWGCRTVSDRGDILGGVSAHGGSGVAAPELLIVAGRLIEGRAGRARRRLVELGRGHRAVARLHVLVGDDVFFDGGHEPVRRQDDDDAVELIDEELVLAEVAPDAVLDVVQMRRERDGRAGFADRPHDEGEDDVAGEVVVDVAVGRERDGGGDLLVADTDDARDGPGRLLALEHLEADLGLGREQRCSTVGDGGERGVVERVECVDHARRNLESEVDRADGTLVVVGTGSTHCLPSLPPEGFVVD